MLERVSIVLPVVLQHWLLTTTCHQESSATSGQLGSSSLPNHGMLKYSTTQPSSVPTTVPEGGGGTKMGDPS